MKNEDIRLHKHLLELASRNLNNAVNALEQVEWAPKTTGIGDSILGLQTAIQQTINVVVRILDDL